jgi:RimJ/RimL family protein N-acetyltransferase
VPLIAPWQEDDLALLEGLLGDPAMTEHLGGPESPQQIAERHAKYLAMTADEPQLRIVDPVDGRAVGWVGCWDRRWRERDVCEVGWAVLPRAQGRGLASAALAELLAYAAGRGRRRFVHAFPSVGNPASNAICRRAGFEDLGPVDFEYPPGRAMRVNDWRLDLRAVAVGEDVGGHRGDGESGRSGHRSPPSGHIGV